GDILDPLATKGDQCPRREHHIKSKHIVGRDAVLHTTQAAGVCRNIAANRANLVRGGIWRIPEPVLSYRRFDISIKGAGLDDGDSGGDIDLDRAHSLQAQDDASGNRRGSAGQPASPPAWHYRYVVLGPPSNCGLHLGSVCRTDNRNRNSCRWVA